LIGNLSSYTKSDRVLSEIIYIALIGWDAVTAIFGLGVTLVRGGAAGRAIIDAI